MPCNSSKKHYRMSETFSHHQQSTIIVLFINSFIVIRQGANPLHNFSELTNIQAITGNLIYVGSKIAAP